MGKYPGWRTRRCWTNAFFPPPYRSSRHSDVSIGWFPGAELGAAAALFFSPFFLFSPSSISVSGPAQERDGREVMLARRHPLLSLFSSSPFTPFSGWVAGKQRGTPFFFLFFPPLPFFPLLCDWLLQECFFDSQLGEWMAFIFSSHGRP